MGKIRQDDRMERIEMQKMRRSTVMKALTAKNAENTKRRTGRSAFAKAMAEKGGAPDQCSPGFSRVGADGAMGARCGMPFRDTAECHSALRSLRMGIRRRAGWGKVSRVLLNAATRQGHGRQHAVPPGWGGTGAWGRFVAIKADMPQSGKGAPNRVGLTHLLLAFRRIAVMIMPLWKKSSNPRGTTISSIVS